MKDQLTNLTHDELYDLYTALRGPDTDDSLAIPVKGVFTTRFRVIAGFHNVVPIIGFSQLTPELWVGVRTKPWWIHFRHHVLLALRATNNHPVWGGNSLVALETWIHSGEFCVASRA